MSHVLPDLLAVVHRIQAEVLNKQEHTQLHCEGKSAVYNVMFSLLLLSFCSHLLAFTTLRTRLYAKGPQTHTR